MANTENWNAWRDKIIGLGDHSSRKSYYPELQKKLSELERFKELLDHSSEAIILAESPSGEIIDLNFTAKQFFKYDPEINNSIHDLLHIRENTRIIDTIINNLNKKNSKLTFELNYSQSENSSIPLEVSMVFDEFNAKQYYVITARDISERKMAEEALRKSEANLKLIFNSVYDAIIIHDFEGRILEVNDRTYKLLKISPDYIKNITIADITAQDHLPYIKQVWDQVNSGSEVLREWHAIQPTTGVDFEVEIALRKIKWFNKDAILAVVREITDRKKSESERLRLQNLESLGLLAGGIAHDFNNILSTIMGGTSLSLLNLPEGKLRTNLKRIEAATERAAGLTRQLLTFARGGAPVKNTVDLRKLIEETTNFSLSGTNVVPFFELNHSNALEVDYAQISQVIQNLVINAHQAMPTGGNITITTSDETINNEVFIKITVKDNGPGISKKNLQKIFDPYFTTKSTGTGLGLSVCYSIIKRHGGIINVESEINKGTKFIILLPASFKMQEDNEKAKVSSSMKLHILIMDDEEDIRNILSEAIKSLGHDVSVSSDQDETLAKIRNSGKPFDVCIMDFTIKGGTSAKELVQEIKKLDDKMKIIVSSGYSDSFLKVYKDYGFDANLNKPYTINDLNNVLSEVFHNKQ